MVVLEISFYEVTNIVSEIIEITNTNRKILIMTDILGQEIPYKKYNYFTSMMTDL